MHLPPFFFVAGRSFSRTTAKEQQPTIRTVGENTWDKVARGRPTTRKAARRIGDNSTYDTCESLVVRDQWGRINWSTDPAFIQGVARKLLGNQQRTPAHFSLESYMSIRPFTSKQWRLTPRSIERLIFCLIEKQWAVKAMHHAETYFSLLQAMDGSKLKLTK